MDAARAALTASVHALAVARLLAASTPHAPACVVTQAGPVVRVYGLVPRPGGRWAVGTLFERRLAPGETAATALQEAAESNY